MNQNMSILKGDKLIKEDGIISATVPAQAAKMPSQTGSHPRMAAVAHNRGVEPLHLDLDLLGGDHRGVDELKQLPSDS